MGKYGQFKYSQDKYGKHSYTAGDNITLSKVERYRLRSINMYRQYSEAIVNCFVKFEGKLSDKIRVKVNDSQWVYNVTCHVPGEHYKFRLTAYSHNKETNSLICDAATIKENR